MSAAGTASQALPQKRSGLRLWWFTIVAVLLTIFIGANAHLVYVAIQSQPECVVQAGADVASDSVLRPAKPAC